MTNYLLNYFTEGFAPLQYALQKKNVKEMLPFPTNIEKKLSPCPLFSIQGIFFCDLW